jgi:hypothetical protein
MGSQQERLRQLEEKKKQVAARIAYLRQRVDASERRKETRRKIIAGSWAWQIFAKGDWTRLGELLRRDQFLEVRDYALFGLKPQDSEPDSSP